MEENPEEILDNILKQSVRNLKIIEVDKSLERGKTGFYLTAAFFIIAVINFLIKEPTQTILGFLMLAFSLGCLIAGFSFYIKAKKSSSYKLFILRNKFLNAEPGNL